MLAVVGVCGSCRVGEQLAPTPPSRPLVRPDSSPWGRGVPVRYSGTVSSMPQPGGLPALPAQAHGVAAHLHTPPCSSGTAASRAEGGGGQIPFQVEDFSPPEQ